MLPKIGLPIPKTPSKSKFYPDVELITKKIKAFGV
jgi:hypothetical protein